MERYDVVVIGSGNAGQSAARVARQHGRRVALVDRRELGGTCALRGCVPKKVLVAAAETLDLIRRAPAHHIQVGPARLNWAALIAREQALIAGTTQGVEKSLASRGVDLHRGNARFVGPEAIDVDGVRLEGSTFVVATGSRPRPLGFPGADALLTSDDLLVRPELPRSAVFVGSGVIGFEFAHVFVRAGVAVTLIGSELLAGFDRATVGRLGAYTRGLGVTVTEGARVTGVERVAGGVRVSWKGAAGEGTVDAEVAFHAAGRVADVDGLDLSAAGVTVGDRGPVVDARLTSVSNPRIRFAGDAVPASPQLSPVATYEGGIVGEERPTSPSYTAVPRVVFTIPPLAAVGLDEQQAVARGLSVDVRESDMRSWRSARTYAEEEAFARIVLERGPGKVLGATILGHGGPEVVHAFAFAIARGLTGEDLAETLYAYPTFHADIKYLVTA